MSDQEKAGGGSNPITRQIGSEQVTFAELSFNKRRTLVRKFKAEEKKNILQWLDEVEASTEMRQQELAVFATDRPGEREWAIFFNSDDGKIEIIEASLRASGLQQSEIDKIMDKLTGSGMDIAELCAAISHTSLDPIIPLSKVEEMVNERVEEVLRSKGVANPTSPNPEGKTGFGSRTTR
jgi:hypothetical protein